MATCPPSGNNINYLSEAKEYTVNGAINDKSAKAKHINCTICLCCFNGNILCNQKMTCNIRQANNAN